jgi:hypothetical protein
MMSKAEMELGLLAGRTLIQEEWADRAEIVAVDELVAEGKAEAKPWEYRAGFQCERRVIRGARKTASELDAAGRPAPCLPGTCQWQAQGQAPASGAAALGREDKS